MVLKVLKLKKEIDMKEAERQKILNSLNAIENREKDIELNIEEVTDSEDLTSLSEEIDKLESEKTELKNQLDSTDEALLKLKKEQNELEKKSKNISEYRNGDKIMGVYKDFDAYIRTKGEQRSGLSSTDVGILIPDETLSHVKDNKPLEDLRKYVTVKKTGVASGKMPILSNHTTSKFVTVEELAKNPELNKLNITEVPYNIKTYRGALPISREAIDDASIDIVSEIVENIKILEVNTSNSAIVEILKTFTKKTIKNSDDLKNIINKDLKANAKKMIIASKSFFAEIDLWKDKNDRYILNDNLATATGKIVSGVDIVVLDDEIFGKAGNAVAFIGDIENSVIFFDRKEIYVNWVDSEIYGSRLMGGLRFDAVKGLPNSGFFVTIASEKG